MFGAFIGDVIGSTYEFEGIKTKDFSLFPPGSKYTDDSIMTVAIGDALINWKNDGGELSKFFVDSMQHYGRKYPFPLGGYGKYFSGWIQSDNPQPYNSCGNGSAMRVSPCGLIAQSL